MHSASALDNAIQSRMRARSRHPPIVIREVQPLAVALSVVGICEAQRQVSLQVRNINEGVNILVLDEMRGDMKIARVASMIQQAMARPKHHGNCRLVSRVQAKNANYLGASPRRPRHNLN